MCIPFAKLNAPACRKAGLRPKFLRSIRNEIFVSSFRRDEKAFYLITPKRLNFLYLCKMIRITKIFTFETAHVLYNYDGKCKNMHGHSYKLFVTVKGTPVNDLDHPKNGMVVDFGDIKKIVKSEILNVWDHAVMLNGNSPHKQLGEDLENQGHKVIYCDYQPTCENMLYDIAAKIKKQLPETVSLAYLKLHETENSYGEWFAEDQV